MGVHTCRQAYPAGATVVVAKQMVPTSRIWAPTSSASIIKSQRSMSANEHARTITPRFPTQTTEDPRVPQSNFIPEISPTSRIAFRIVSYSSKRMVLVKSTILPIRALPRTAVPTQAATCSGSVVDATQPLPSNHHFILLESLSGSLTGTLAKNESHVVKTVLRAVVAPSQDFQYLHQILLNLNGHHRQHRRQSVLLTVH